MRWMANLAAKTRLLPVGLLLLSCSLVVPAAQAAPADSTRPGTGASATASASAVAIEPGGRLAVRLEKLRLANGFELILVPDHRLPLVAFNLWVHAGPRNEAQGQTGFAHLFEHLMFAGTRHIPRGQMDRIVDAAGGTDSNGSTDFDRTNYYFTLPSNQLELGLWLKSDMLGYMIDEVDSVALANQQDVVRNERRQSIENRPYGIVDEAIYRELFPAGHPYRALVMGSHEDIQSIKLADVKAFARRYYRPNNATLVLAGDFDPARAKALVQTYFGPLQPGEPVPELKVAQPKITAERRITVTDRIELPRLTIAWHTPAVFQRGDAELDVASHILGGGKSSRLYKTLVYDKQLAQSVQVLQGSASLGSVFSIEVLARPGKSLDEIEAIVNAELDALAGPRLPTLEELQRARAAIETGLLARLEKLGALADQINYYNQQAGDPGYVGKDLSRYQTLSPEDVRAVVAAQLRRDARVVAQALPGDKQLPPEPPTPPMPTKASKGEREAMNAPAEWRRRQPPPTAAAPLAIPQAQRSVLPNGLALIHIPRPGLPLVSASLVLRAGQSANPPAQPGLASFTAAMLQQGTRTRSALQLADEASALGLALSSGAGSDSASISLGVALKRNFAPGLALLADMAMNPAFDAAEIARLKSARLAALAQQREEPEAIAALTAARAVYGDAHLLGQNPLGSEAAIAAVDAAALRAFWQQHYRPDQAALVVAGDIDAAELRALAEQHFGAWQRPAAEAAASAAPLAKPQPTRSRIVFVDKPGAQQTALAVVAPGPRAGVPDEAALKIANAALGGLFTSRINTQLREVKGYTYGIYSGFNQGRELGDFGIRGSVRSDATGAALKDMFREIEAMRAKPMGRPELERVRNAQLLALPGLFDTNAALASGYAGEWAKGLPADHLATLPARYRAVTAQDALRALRTHLRPEDLIVVAVGDKGQVEPQLKALKRGKGRVEVRDAAGGPSDSKR